MNGSDGRRRWVIRSFFPAVAGCSPGFASYVLLLAMLMVAGGCGGSSRTARKLVAVSGTVTLDGRPLPEGFVTFVSPIEGHFEAFPITEGAFAGKAGLGNRRVEIIAMRDLPPPGSGPNPSGPLRAVQENYLPAKYSTESTLSAEVTEAGPNEFTFDLKMRK